MISPKEQRKRKNEAFWASSMIAPQGGLRRGRHRSPSCREDPACTAAPHQAAPQQAGSQPRTAYPRTASSQQAPPQQAPPHQAPPQQAPPQQAPPQQPPPQQPPPQQPPPQQPPPQGCRKRRARGSVCSQGGGGCVGREREGTRCSTPPQTTDPRCSAADADGSAS